MSIQMVTHTAKTFGKTSQELFNEMPQDYIGTVNWVKKTHGDLVQFKAFRGLVPMVFILDPELNREVFIRHNDKLGKGGSQVQTFRYAIGRSLVTEVGPAWREKRHEANHLFSRQTVEALFPGMVHAAQQILGDAPGSHTGYALAKSLSAATTGRAVLGRNITSAEAHQMMTYSDEVRKRFNLESKHLFPKPHWMLAPWRKDLTRQMDAIQPMVQKAISDAQNADASNDGLMAHLFSDVDIVSKENEIQTLMTGLLAGALDNVAIGIAWWMAYMAHYPHWQEKCANEIAQVRPKSVEDLAKCKINRACLQEVLRLRPPAQANQPRILTESIEIAGVKLRRGTFIFNSFWHMHHDAAWFDNPLEFDPERFLAPDHRSKTAYAPFGQGPRNCVAQGMAMQQILAIAAELLGNFKIAAEGEFPEYEQIPFLAPKPFSVTLNRR